jgi:hypothetical protein
MATAIHRETVGDYPALLTPENPFQKKAAKVIGETTSRLMRIRWFSHGWGWSPWNRISVGLRKIGRT